MLPNRFNVRDILIWFLYSQLRSVISFLNVKKRLSLRQDWRELARSKKGSVILIANGPSFTEELVSIIKSVRDQYDIAAVNFYCMNDAAQLLVPDFYILSDFAHLCTLDEAVENKNNALVTYLKENNCKLFVPYGPSWARYGKIFARFDDTENLFSTNINPIFPRGYPSNTFFKAIAIMTHLGYDNIYLLGFDYDYPRKIFLDQDNKIKLNLEFHYGSNVLDYSDIFCDVAHALRWWAQDYHNVRKLNSVRITNVTNTSMIDAFKRLDPSDFIELLKGH